MGTCLLVLRGRLWRSEPDLPRRRCGRLGITVALLAVAAAVASAVDAGAAGSEPAIGTAPTSVDLRAVPGAVPYNDGHAIPLKAARPAWYTDEMSSRARNSPGTPQPAPTDAPLPGVVGIRPGSWMIEPYGCTMNFVFARGSQLGIGTAGHCTDMLRQDVVLLTLTPGSNNPVLIDIGKVVARDDNGVGDDFALVNIYPQLYSWVSATTAVIGGPCGAYYGSGPELVWHYGQGLGIGTGGTPRSGPALTWEENAFGWDSAAIFGDSGSPVRVTSGLQAAGDLTHLVVDANWLPSFIVGTRIEKILRIASGWQLASSPLCL
jgi:hypothetical protein